MNLRSLVRLKDSPGRSGVLLAAVFALFSVTSAQAALTYSGDISPATDPSTWTSGSSGTTAYIGYNTGNGTLALDNGSQVLSSNLYLGYASGRTGTVTVDGSGSALTMSTALYSGYSGSGILNVTNGGAVNVGTSYLYLGYNAGSTGTITIDGAGSTMTSAAYNYIGRYGNGFITVRNGGSFVGTATYSTYLGNSSGGSGTITVDGAGSSWAGNGNLYVGYGGSGTLNVLNGSSVTVAGNTAVGASGSVNFGANGGTLTTGGIMYSSSQLSGLGTINTSGLVTDMDLVFNASHGTAQSFSKNGITVNLTQGAAGALGAGYSGSGSLTIADGVTVASKGGYLGYNSRSTGAAMVTGPGSTWTAGNLYVGNSGAATLTISNVGSVNSTSTYLGYNLGSTGTATVTGPGSTWTSSNTMYLGYNGSGTLNITNGAVVSAAGARFAYDPSVTGTAIISGAGSKFSINGGADIGYYGNGLISVTNGGTLTTTDTTRIGFNSSSTSSVTVNGAGSSWNGSGSSLTVGASGIGTLNITNGGTVTTATIYGINIADNPTYGTVNVSGPGSTWTATSNATFYISRMGTAKMNITNGGKVVSSAGAMYVGYTNNSGGSGNVTVNGSGSLWSHTGTVNVGWKQYGGIGRLVIGDGGTVSASSLVITAPSLVTADLGRGSSLTLGNGTGTLINDGTIRLVAGAGAANGTYSPISAGTWAGTGTVQALGGIWDATNHTVTVSSAATGAAGVALTNDLSTTQRFLFADGSTGKSVGASLQAASSPTDLTLTASAIGGSELTSLQSLLDPGKSVLSGWDFTAEGYTAGTPVYLSLWAGNNTNLSDLTVWHYDGSTWTKYAASDLAYDKTYASFTVNGFSGYAVTGTAPVPIPAAAWLLGSGLMGLVGLRRRFMA